MNHQKFYNSPYKLLLYSNVWVFAVKSIEKITEMITLRKTLVALELSGAFNLGSAVYEIMSYIFNKHSKMLTIIAFFKAALLTLQAI